METGGPAATTVSKRKLRSTARLQEFQRARRLSRLRGILLHAIKRLRFDRMWWVHNEWYAARARSALACDSHVGEATPMESEAIGATRAEASAEQRSTAASRSTPTLQEASSAEFVPGLPWAEVESAMRSAAASLDTRSDHQPHPGGNRMLSAPPVVQIPRGSSSVSSSTSSNAAESRQSRSP